VRRTKPHPICSTNAEELKIQRSAYGASTPGYRAPAAFLGTYRMGGTQFALDKAIGLMATVESERTLDPDNPFHVVACICSHRRLLREWACALQFGKPAGSQPRQPNPWTATQTSPSYGRAAPALPGSQMAPDRSASPQRSVPGRRSSGVQLYMIGDGDW